LGGDVEPDEREVAPHFVGVDNQLIQWLVQSRWTDPWGIFVICSTEPRLLRQHLRGLLNAVGPDASSFFFRYYDPRVLVRFLPTCTLEEVDEFFGPVQGFGLVDTSSRNVEFFLRA
jgi:hypothetical protein